MLDKPGSSAVLPFSPLASVAPQLPLAWPEGVPAGEDPLETLQMDWLIEGWMERGDAVFWSGDPGVGKSVTITALLIALCTQRPLLGLWDPPEGPPLRCALLDLENRSVVLRRRIIRLCMGLGLDYRKLVDGPRGPLFPFALRGRQIFSDAATSITSSMLKAVNPDLFVVDTIMSATAQKGLSPLEGVNFVRQHLFRIQNELGPRVGCWAVHHTKKPTEDPRMKPEDKDARLGDLHQSSGGGFIGMADALIMVQEDSSHRIVLTNPKQRHTKDRNKYYLTMDDGGDPLAPLILSVQEGDSTPKEDTLTVAAACQEFIIQAGGRVKRIELEDFLALRDRCSERTARRRIASLVDLGMLLDLGWDLEAKGKAGKLVGIPVAEADTRDPAEIQ